VGRVPLSILALWGAGRGRAELCARVVCQAWHTTFSPLVLVRIGFAPPDTSCLPGLSQKRCTGRCTAPDSWLGALRRLVAPQRPLCQALAPAPTARRRAPNCPRRYPAPEKVPCLPNSVVARLYVRAGGGARPLALMALGEHAMKGESHAPPPVDPDPPPRSRPRRNPRPAPPAPDRLRPHLPRARPPPSAPSRLRLADLPVGGLPALPPCPLTRDRPQGLGR